MTSFGDPQHQETTEKLDKTFTIIYFIGLDFGHSLGSPQEETARERSEGLFPDQFPASRGLSRRERPLLAGNRSAADNRA